MQLHQKVCIHPQGYSMWPFLKEGRDSVIVKPLPVSSMHRGDIILYRRNDQILVLHRLHHKNKKDFFLTGVNQTKIEGPVRQKEILCCRFYDIGELYRALSDEKAAIDGL